MKVARLTISDRASAGVYTDLGGPAIQAEIERLFAGPFEWRAALVPDEAERIAAALARFVDRDDCWLALTTGGTGLAPRDVTPEATRRILDRELPGFSEAMRMTAFARVPTTILSRAVAGSRKRSLVINLPGNPKAIAESLPPLAPAIAEAIFHLRGERLRLLTPRRSAPNARRSSANAREAARKRTP
ncbi:MAG: molybdopterin adenylyltransferase [Verrucomicrobiae bacterium]|nr:molybdopterin adenylyltransferase [Verrucomicrobiae bacterium]